MIFVSMVIRAHAGKAEDLAQAMVRMMAQTRDEDGCVGYTYSRDLADDQVFHLTEIWQDEPRMNAHIDAAHSAAFVATLSDTGRIISLKSYGGDVEKHRIRAPS